MGRTNELVREYDALCGRNPPMEEIVAFLRERCPNGDALFHLMRDSTARGYILLTPAFLLALRDDDYEILKAIGSWVCDGFNNLRLKVDFVGRILGMKEFIPARIRALLWNAIRERCRSERINCCPGEYAENVVNYIGIRPNLLQDPPVNWHYPTLLTEKMQAALEQDSVPLFEIELTMTGKRVAKRLLDQILRYRAASLLSHLLRKRSKALAAILPPTDLLFHICAKVPEDRNKTLASVLDTLEELYPGICRETVDTLGNTPLWYCLYEQHTTKMEEALIRYGCDPDARNHLGLSYNLCKDWDV